MALPYPEGEVYFKRSALKLPQGDYKFSADEPASFYTHVLVEQVWNTWASSNNTTPSIKNIPGHKRAQHQTGTASLYRTEFGVWNQTCVMFSDDLPKVPDQTAPSQDPMMSMLYSMNNQLGSRMEQAFGNQQLILDVPRTVTLKNNENYNELRDRDQGGPLKTILRPVPMGSEKYMYLDLNTPIRAVYFPLAHKSSALNQDLCTYVMVDFRLRRGVKIRHQDSKDFVPLDFSYDLGLGKTDQFKTLCFDVPGIISYLCLPRQMRALEMGLYTTATLGDELITLWDSEKLPADQNVVERHFIRSIDLAEVISDNFGVDVVWQPYEYSSFAIDMLTTVINLGLALIPTAGPLLAAAFHIGLQAITDPKAFELENVLKLDAEVMAAVLATVISVKSGGKSGGGVAKAGSKSASIARNLPKGYKGSKVTIVSSK